MEGSSEVNNKLLDATKPSTMIKALPAAWRMKKTL